MKTKFDMQDIIGKQFGRLTVLEYCGKDEKGQHIYKCQCECGNICIVQRNCLRAGSTRSCGCLAKCWISLDDIIGKRYGRLVVVRYIGKKERHPGKSPEHFYLCHCDCGNDVEISRRTLLSGRINNCGHCARIIKENDYYRYICPNGQSWIFDEIDLEFVKSKRWHINSKKYPATYINKSQKSFHQMIFDLPKELRVDHINGNNLDNRRSNLRYATSTENMQNKIVMPYNSTGYKGVTFAKANKKYRANIRINGETTHLGYFYTAEEAAKAYDEAARKHFGEFACVNFPLPGEQSCHRKSKELDVA